MDEASVKESKIFIRIKICLLNKTIKPNDLYKYITKYGKITNYLLL